MRTAPADIGSLYEFRHFIHSCVGNFVNFMLISDLDGNSERVAATRPKNRETGA